MQISDGIYTDSWLYRVMCGCLGEVLGVGNEGEWFSLKAFLFLQKKKAVFGFDWGKMTMRKPVLFLLVVTVLAPIVLYTDRLGSFTNSSCKFP